MGRAILSNNKKWINQLHKRLMDTGIHINLKRDDMVIYDKLNIHVENYVISGGTVIACNGTLIYRDMIGKEALEKLYSDYKECGKRIDNVRKNCFGSYFVIIQDEDRTTAFVDETGTYAIYYSYDGINYLVTNTYYHVVSTKGGKINVQSNIEEFLEFCIIDNETPFNGVSRLSGDEMIIIDNHSFSIEKVCTNSNSLEGKRFEEVAVEIKNEVIKYTTKLQLISNKPVLFMTGGVDSRLTLATYLASSIRPELCSWGGNPFKMNTKDEDVEVSRKVANTENLEFKYVDVSEEDTHAVDEIPRDQFEKYGEWATIYGNNRKWFSIFEDKSNYAYEFGYFGEIIKGWELLDVIDADKITIDDFCEIYTSRQSYHFDSKSTIDIDSYKERVHLKLKNLAQKLGFDDKALSKEDCMVMYYTYRLHADTKCCNFANIFGYCTPVLAHKPVADLINQCPYIFKQHDRINLYITKIIDEKLLNIQYFTHSKFMVLDQKNLRLEYLEKDLRKQRLINATKKMHIYPFLKKVKRVFKSNQSKNAIMMKVYSEYINEYPYFADAGIVVNEKTFDYPPMAISMLCQCQMIDNALR